MLGFLKASQTILMCSQACKPLDERDFGGGSSIIQLQKIIKEEVVIGTGSTSWECGAGGQPREGEEQGKL